MTESPTLRVPRRTGECIAKSTAGRNELTIDEHQERLRGTKWGLLSYDEAVRIHGQAEADRWFAKHGLKPGEPAPTIQEEPPQA